MNDKSALTQFLQTHQELFETRIDCLGTDKGYYSIANEEAAIESLNQDGLLHLGYRYEDMNEKDDKTVKDRRAGIEAIIGHIKQGGQLKKSREKSDSTTLASGYGAMLGYNLCQLTRCLIGKKVMFYVGKT